MKATRPSSHEAAVALLAAALAGGLAALMLGFINGWLEAGLIGTVSRCWLPAGAALALPSLLLRSTRGALRWVLLLATYVATLAGIVLWRLQRFGWTEDSLFWGEEVTWLGTDDAGWGLLIVTVLVAASSAAWLARRHATGLAIGAWATSLLLPLAFASPPRDTVNVLLITVDTVRADFLSLYGHERTTTPVLDAATRAGLVFDAYYSQSSWTAPTMASMVTGLPVGIHGVTEQRALASQHATAAEYLHDAGYKTALISGNDIVGPLFGLGQGYEVYVPLDEEAPRAAEVLSDAVVELLARWRGRPFFIHAHYMDPHEIYSPPSPWRDRFKQTNQPLPAHANVHDGEVTDEVAARVSEGLLSDADLSWLRALYEGELGYVDDQIGRVLAALDELDLTGQTLVVVAGDHGESFGERGRVLHGHNLHREQVHSLLALLVPGGRVGRVRAVAQSLDVFHTVLGAAGIEPGADFGKDLRVLDDEARRVVHQRLAKRRLDDLAAVTVGRFKLIVAAETDLQLFDLDTDPWERNDISADPEYAPQLRELYAQRGLVAPRFQLDLSPSTRTMRERELRALGYIK